MERVLGLNQSLVDSFARQQATPEPSSQSLGEAPPTYTPPSKLAAGSCTQSGFACLVSLCCPTQPSKMTCQARTTDLSHCSFQCTATSHDVSHDRTVQPIATFIHMVSSCRGQARQNNVMFDCGIYQFQIVSSAAAP